MRVYKSYNFRTKDPAIDKLRTIVQDADVSYTRIHDDSNVSVTTMYGWFHGKTLRPQHATLAAVAGALGYDWALVKRNGKNGNHR